MLKKDKFLPTASLLSCRDDLYELFKSVFEYLKELNPKVSINDVECGDAVYRNGGHVTIPLNPKNKGVLFHEVGHALLADSVFHSNYLSINKGGNENWGDAFAEAVRWLMEKKHFGKSEWLKCFEEKKSEPTTSEYRADLILTKAKYDMVSFKELWLKLTSEFDETKYYLDRQLLNR